MSGHDYERALVDGLARSPSTIWTRQRAQGRQISTGSGMNGPRPTARCARHPSSGSRLPAPSCSGTCAPSRSATPGRRRHQNLPSRSHQVHHALAGNLLSPRGRRDLLGSSIHARPTGPRPRASGPQLGAYAAERERLGIGNPASARGLFGS